MNQSVYMMADEKNEFIIATEVSFELMNKYLQSKLLTHSYSFHFGADAVSDSPYPLIFQV